jgi:hypothetical protein
MLGIGRLFVDFLTGRRYLCLNTRVFSQQRHSADLFCPPLRKEKNAKRELSFLFPASPQSGPEPKGLKGGQMAKSTIPAS